MDYVLGKYSNQYIFDYILLLLLTPRTGRTMGPAIL